MLELQSFIYNDIAALGTLYAAYALDTPYAALLFLATSDIMLDCYRLCMMSLVAGAMSIELLP